MNGPVAIHLTCLVRASAAAVEGQVCLDRRVA